MLRKIKSILKRVLPPPVASFMREINGLRQLMAGLEQKVLRQEELARKLAEQNDRQEKLAKELADRQLELVKQQKQFQDQQKQFQDQQQKALEALKKLEELGKLDILRAELENTRRAVSSAQAGVETTLTKAAEQQQKLYSVASANQKALGEIPRLRNQVQRLENGALRLIPQPRLAYFVLNILDHCNLRCKGCDHFAAIAEKHFVALDDICRDLEKMSQLTHQSVTRIGVMGGEPLLHPQLNEILVQTRRWFPQTLIQLVSNGLLMLRQDDAFWETCRDNDISIVVTKYPIELDFERMEQTARDWGVSFEYYGKTGEVMKTSYKMPMDVNGQQDPIKSFWGCYHANSKPLLMEGKFYSCTVAPNARHFNKKFGASMELETGDYLDIHSISDINELYRFLCTPKPFCRYCRTSERSFGHPWERSKQVAEEWT